MSKEYHKLETEWTKDICDFIKKSGVMTRPLVGGILTPDGWEDRLIICPLQIFLVEFKGPKTVLSAQQKIILQKHHRLTPGAVMVARRMPRRIAGELLHPVTQKLLCPFAGPEKFVRALFVAKFVLEQAVEAERGVSLQKMKELQNEKIGIQPPPSPPQT